MGRSAFAVLALGAAPHPVRWIVVALGMRLTMLGLALGLAAAYALTRYMSSLLFGVNIRDPPCSSRFPVCSR